MTTPEGFRFLRDTAGGPSRTLIMCYACLLTLLGKFVLGGLTIMAYTFPVISAGEFGLAATGIVGVWVYRDNARKALCATAPPTPKAGPPK